MARGDWVPCVGWGLSVAVPGNDAAHVPLVVTRDAIDVATDAEVGTVEESSKTIVMRVVGSVHIVPTTTALTHERIRVGIYDNAGATAFYANTFALAADANEPFLWQRHISFDVSGAGNCSPTRSHPYWSLVDVRVSRKLEAGTGLFYTLETLTAGDVRFTPYLRSYARSVG